MGGLRRYKYRNIQAVRAFDVNLVTPTCTADLYSQRCSLCGGYKRRPLLLCHFSLRLEVGYVCALITSAANFTIIHWQHYSRTEYMLFHVLCMYPTHSDIIAHLGIIKRIIRHSLQHHHDESKNAKFGREALQPQV